MSIQLERLQFGGRRAAGWTTTALAFTIPIWVVADSILIGLLVVCWAAYGKWREKILRISANPVAVSAILLFAWLLVGTLWGEGDWEERATWVKKYANLLLIPLVISMSVDDEERNRALLALAASLIVTLILSLVLSMGLFSPKQGLTCDSYNPCVFKKHTTHGLLMGFGTLLFGVLAWKSSQRWVRWGWGVASCLAASNVLLMVQGRTGYVVLAGLAVVAFQSYLGWRGMLSAIIALSMMFTMVYHVSTTFHDRVDLVATGVTRWNPQVATYDGVTERMEFFYHTVEIIRDHPLMGVGTGGFAKAYAVRVQDLGLPVPAHPHNQYLLVMAQVGVVGIGLLLWLFVQQWRSSTLAVDAAHGLLGRGVMVTIAISCLFQPALIDHTEKLFYCLFSGLLFSSTNPHVETKI